LDYNEIFLEMQRGLNNIRIVEGTSIIAL
jgi:hypothetical protein